MVLLLSGLNQEHFHFDQITGYYTDATFGTSAPRYTSTTILFTPEPATLALVALGGAALLRRKK